MVNKRYNGYVSAEEQSQNVLSPSCQAEQIDESLDEKRLEYLSGKCSMEHERGLRTMHESRESSPSPDDRGQRGNGDGAVSRPGSRPGVRDVVRDARSENGGQGVGGRPDVEYNGGPSSEHQEMGASLRNLYKGTWRWPSSFEEPPHPADGGKGPQTSGEPRDLDIRTNDLVKGLKEVPLSKDATAEKMLKESSYDATSSDHNRPSSSSSPDGQLESRGAGHSSPSVVADTLRQKLQDTQLQSSDQARPRARNGKLWKERPEDKPQSEKVPRQRARNGKLFKERKQDKTGISEFSEKAREPASVPPDILRQKLNDGAGQNIDKGKEEGRGDDTVENKSWQKAQAMMDQWKAENLPGIQYISTKQLLNHFPAIELATELSEAIDTKKMEHIQSSKSDNRPRSHEWSAEIRQMEKDRQILEEAFPKNPSDVSKMYIHIMNEGWKRARAMVDEWQDRKLPGADQVKPGMIIRKYGEVIQKAITLEKTNNNVVSVRESLQATKKQLPKNPSEVINAYKAEIANREREIASSERGIASSEREIANRQREIAKSKREIAIIRRNLQSEEKQDFSAIAKDLSKQFMQSFEGKEKSPLPREEQQAIMSEAKALLRTPPDYIEGAQAQSFLEGLKEKGRGNKTVENAALKEAQTRLDEWEAAGMENAYAVPKNRIVQNFPAFRLVTELGKAIERERMEMGELVKLQTRTDLSNPGGLRDVFTSVWGNSIAKMEKDRQILKESFPKSPDEVFATHREIKKEVRDKANALVNKWREDNLPDAGKVDKEMVLYHFWHVIWETTALEKLEKANGNVASVRESLQETKEQLPKNPSEVLNKHNEETANLERVLANRQRELANMERELANIRNRDSARHLIEMIMAN